MRNLNTKFAVMVETPSAKNFVRNGKRICIFTMREAMKIQNEMKSNGYHASLIPYCG